MAIKRTKKKKVVTSSINLRFMWKWCTDYFDTYVLFLLTDPCACALCDACVYLCVCVCVSFQPKQLKMKNVPPVTSAPSIHWETWCIFMFVCSAHFPSHPIKFGSVYMYHKYALFRNVLQKINRMTALWDVVGFTSFDQFTFFTVSKSQLVIYQLNLDLVGA